MRIRTILIFVSFLFIAGSYPASVTASSPGGTPQSLPTQSLIIESADGRRHLFTVEVARTMREKTIGLMFRDSMPADRGMIFLHDDEQMRSFWMQNTYIPLDLLFIDEDWIIRTIKQGEPLSLNGIPSEVPVQYVLEINAGISNMLGIQPGDRVIFNN